MFRGFVIGVVLTILAGLAAVYVVVTMGLIPANADAKPGELERWVAGTSLRATLEGDAPKGPNPVELTDANLIAGIQLYAEHCVLCHGAAKGEPSAIAKGLYPQPPQLASDGVEDDPEGESFWKIQHGIRWTAMPSWAGTLKDQQIWTLALFLKHMDKLPPAAEQVWQNVHN